MQNIKIQGKTPVFSSLKGIITISNNGKNARKPSSTGWNDRAVCNVNIQNDGQTYTFRVKIVNLNKDKSGMIFGFSDNSDVSLNSINSNVGLSAHSGA